ncbi:MAG TPA: TonB family protein [Rhizomicrobium sp.]|nr:TonB family protein [Rhizomicrobium sp.]
MKPGSCRQKTFRAGCAPTILLMLIAAAANAETQSSTNPGAPNCVAAGSQRPEAANDHAIDSNNYPLLSWMNGEAGNVMLDFRINVDGTVDDVTVARSSGSARLDGAAVDAVNGHWRYKPVVFGGKPVACRYRAIVAWRIPLDPLQWAKFGYGVVQMHAPDYPPGVSSQTGGITAILMTIGVDGSMLDAKVVHSSGIPELDSAAMTALKNQRWPITPAKMQGTALKSVVGLLVVWSP